ncbi:MULTISPECIES: helix-turn-helix domain-containing protein [Lactococcus]|uniref:helix-turn-helix domain-containing protein n=1 Tax=Lactococcus TaxID=1357 RepID=UPI0018AC59E3|nr:MULTISPECIES: helix-turn-helix transcriptional regulator [Lactococcus]MDC0826086.1 helix-turn-helix transcriptional regulator [Lactococcus petauri]
MVTIAELRAKHGKMSQKELAKNLNVTQSAISNWEKDQLGINGRHLIGIAKFFKVSTDDLLGISV